MTIRVRIRPQQFLRALHALALQLIVQIHLAHSLAAVVNVFIAEQKRICVKIPD